MASLIGAPSPSSTRPSMRMRVPVASGVTRLDSTVFFQL
jgi:hypothetical protein